jgi:hypothetical protein
MNFKPRNFFERRRPPVKGRRWKGPERRIHWRNLQLSVRLMVHELLGHWYGPPQKEIPHRRIQSLERIRKNFKERPGANEAIDELESNGVEVEFVLRMSMLLARTPLKAFKMTEYSANRIPKRAVELAKLATKARSEAALCNPAVLRLDDRELWIVQNLPELIKEYETISRKISSSVERLPKHFIRDEYVQCLGDHVQKTTGSYQWESIATLISAFSVPHGEVPKIANARNLEKAYERARKRPS